MSWHRGLMAAFDTETSGVDVEQDRIVTATVCLVDNGGIKDQRGWLINPGVEIPEAATAVHGITSEHARAAGDDAATAVLQIMTALYNAWEIGAVVVGYNVPFDFTLLDRELRRHNGFGLEIRGPVVDPLVVDKALDRYRKGKRTLTACCEQYGVRLDGAHDATEDALAAARLAWKLAELYPDELGDLDALQAKQQAWKAEQSASFADYLRRKGEDASGVDGAWPIRPLVAAVAS